MSKYKIFSGPYFPVFGPEKTPYLNTFHAVRIYLNNVTHHCGYTTCSSSFWSSDIFGIAHSRSSCREVFCKKSVLRNLRNFQEHLFLQNTTGGCFSLSPSFFNKFFTSYIEQYFNIERMLIDFFTSY